MGMVVVVALPILLLVHVPAFFGGEGGRHRLAT